MHLSHGHSVHHQQMERVGGGPPLASVKPHKSSGHGCGFAIKDRVDLSPTAQKFVETQGHCYGPGKSMHAMAHRAKAMIEANPQLADMPFGQVVSQMIHGTLDLTPPTDGIGETGAPADVGETGDVPVADGEGADVAVLPAVDDGTEAADGEGADVAILPAVEDGTEATDGKGADVSALPPVDETSETAGDEGAAEGTVTAGLDDAGEPIFPEPVVTVDTTSTLLDMLNESEDDVEVDQAA